MRVVNQSSLLPKGSKSKALHKPRPKLAPVPKVEVAAPNVEVSAPNVEIDLSPLVNSNKEVLTTIAELLKVQQAPATKPTEWDFEIHRGSNNLITRVTAKAK